MLYSEKHKVNLSIHSFMLPDTLSISIEKLRLRCILGVLPHERENKQEVVVSVTVKLNDTVAAASDNLSDTVDYGALADSITAFVENSSFQLVERLAAGILEVIMANPKISRADVKVEKPGTFALRFADTVTIQVAGVRHGA